MSSVSSSTHGLSYAAANIYAASRHQDGLFPFPMHFATPATFPFDNYYIPSPYYPHLTESLNLKLSQGIYKQPQPSASYDLEIGRVMTSNLTLRAPELKNISTPSETVKEKENEVTSSEELSSLPISDSLRMKSTQSLYDSATKLLFLSIRWAKSIPSFNQLPLNDQKMLLNDSWAELFVIAASQWGLIIDDEIACNSLYLKHLQDVVKHFVSLKIDHFEAACLKALILFRDGVVEGQTTSQHILLLQNQTLCLLLEKCGGLRFGHLLLTLPQIKFAGNVQNLQVRFDFHVSTVMSFRAVL